MYGVIDMFCKVDSLYIIVDDMERAISFYEDFFEQKVSEKGEVGSCFNVDGFRFNLFAYKMVNEHTYMAATVFRVCILIL